MTVSPTGQTRIVDSETREEYTIQRARDQERQLGVDANQRDMAAAGGKSSFVESKRTRHDLAGRTVMSVAQIRVS
jgi:hypothetical protein